METVTHFKKVKSAMCIISYKGNGKTEGSIRAWVFLEHLTHIYVTLETNLVSGLCGRKQLI